MNNLLSPCSKEELLHRENFKKDYKFSCPVLDDNDIFKKSLLIAELTQEWDDYYEMCKTIPNFDQYRRDMLKNIIQLLSSVPGYKNLDNIITPTNKYSGPNSYLKDELIGKRLLSVDLIMGNYQAMKHINPAYVWNSNTYEDLIRGFTKYEPIIRSKMFRQMIFGQLNPRVQGIVQKNMIDEIITEIYNLNEFKKQYEICFLSNDEVIFVIDNDYDKAQIEYITKKMKYKIRVTEFNIEKIPNSYDELWYVKNYKGYILKKKIIGVHTRYLLQVYNHLLGLDNEPKDFWWRECGRLCTLLEPEVFQKTYTKIPLLYPRSISENVELK